MSRPKKASSSLSKLKKSARATSLGATSSTISTPLAISPTLPISTSPLGVYIPPKSIINAPKWMGFYHAGILQFLISPFVFLVSLIFYAIFFLLSQIGLGFSTKRFEKSLDIHFIANSLAPTILNQISDVSFQNIYGNRAKTIFVSKVAAVLSDVAYSDGNDAAKLVETIPEQTYQYHSGVPTGFSFKKVLPYLFPNRISNETQMHVVTTASAVFIAFRGTEPLNIRDWSLSNQPELEVPFPTLPEVQIRASYLIQLAYFHDDLAKIRKEHTNKTIFICGHSLGGSLATIAHLLYFHSFRNTVSITFGEPTCGNENFAQLYNETFPAQNHFCRRYHHGFEFSHFNFPYPESMSCFQNMNLKFPTFCILKFLQFCHLFYTILTCSRGYAHHAKQYLHILEKRTIHLNPNSEKTFRNLLFDHRLLLSYICLDSL